MNSMRVVKRCRCCVFALVLIASSSRISPENILVALGGRGHTKQGTQGNATSASHYIPSAITSLLGKFKGTDLSGVIKVADLHDPNLAIRPIREGALSNWTFVAQEVKEGGHSWCAITRDNWSCVGEQYKKVLRSTPMFDESWSMNAFPPNTNIYIEGNSLIAELVYGFVCGTPSVDVWFVDGVDGNSIVAYAPKTNVTLFMLSNHRNLQVQPESSLGLLRQIEFIPNYIIRGPVNWVRVETFISLTERHRKIYMKEFPAAYYQEYFDPHTPTGCFADFMNCREFDGFGHPCMPGPISMASEDFVKTVLLTDPSKALCNPPDCQCKQTSHPDVVMCSHS